MKNIEKYKDIVLEDLNNCHLESRLRMLYGKEVVNCSEIHCGECKERFLKWLLEEYKESAVLDDVEREYLSSVIKPFRNRVTSIVKIENTYAKKQFIRIVVCHEEHVNLPYFKKTTKYNGMKVDKKYTPKELGL